MSMNSIAGFSATLCFWIRKSKKIREYQKFTGYCNGKSCVQTAMNHENMGFSSTSLRSCWKPTHKKQRIHNAYIETSKVSVSKVLAVQKLSGINRKGAVMWQCIGQGVHLLHWQVVKLQDRTLLRLIADAKVVFCLDSLYGRGSFDGFMDSNIRQKPKKVLSGNCYAPQSLT